MRLAHQGQHNLESSALGDAVIVETTHGGTD